MKKLFTNVGGNKFKLLTESVNNAPTRPELVREAVKKIFSSNDREISYSKLYNVGLGYIKDITEARKCALQEAKQLANSFGYADDEARGKFVKENDFSKLSAESPESNMAKVSSEEHPHDESNINNPEEKREVQIAKEIITITNGSYQHLLDDELMVQDLEKIQHLAKELIKMHSPSSKKK